MERYLEASLKELKELLIGMAKYVEQAIAAATGALQTQDAARIQSVYEIEKHVNADHIRVDEACLKLLALQQPLAADLRLIIAIIKINTDLERMGDQAVNIAHNTERYIQGEPLKQLIDLPKMSSDVMIMVSEAIESFVKRDLALAKSVLQRDDAVDGLKGKIFRDVLEHIKADPAKIEQGLSLILIARNLERIGDHATNIAEDVIFAITGDDIRHTPRPEQLREVLKS
jgi:phosphate transport system protein